MDKPLHEIAGAVCDEKSFLEFVKALIADRERAVEAEKRKPSSPYGPGRGWENTSIATEIRKAITSVAVVQPINDYVGLVGRGLTEARNWITDKGSAKLRKAAGIGSSKDA